LKTRDAVGVGREYLRQDLQRDLTTEFEIARPPYFAHAADADRRDYFESTEPTADSDRHVLSNRKSKITRLKITKSKVPRAARRLSFRRHPTAST
jgi:hypothetical protein